MGISHPLISLPASYLIRPGRITAAHREVFHIALGPIEVRDRTIPEGLVIVSKDDDGFELPPWPLILASIAAGALLGVLLLWWGFLVGHRNGVLGRRIRRLQGDIRGRTSHV